MDDLPLLALLVLVPDPLHAVVLFELLQTLARCPSEDVAPLFIRPLVFLSLVEQGRVGLL